MSSADFTKLPITGYSVSIQRANNNGRQRIVAKPTTAIVDELVAEQESMSKIPKTEIISSPSYTNNPLENMLPEDTMAGSGYGMMSARGINARGLSMSTRAYMDTLAAQSPYARTSSTTSKLTKPKRTYKKKYT